MAHKGSCLCGGVRYEINGEIGDAVMCHCRSCRKASGSAYATNAPVATSDFQLVRGNQLIREYESSRGKVRAFCGNCGSPLFVRRADDTSNIRLRLGTLDTPLGRHPVAHIFAMSCADWDRIRDDLPQYEAREPGR